MPIFVTQAYRARFVSDLISSYAVGQLGSDYIGQASVEELTAAIAEPLGDPVDPIDTTGFEPDFVLVLRWFDRIYSLIHFVPPRWINDFSTAATRGAISAVAFGAAARMIYLGYSPEDETAGQHHQAFLKAFRRAPADGLMAPVERADFEALPETITLYRGSFATDHVTAALGLSWSRSPHYPRIHVQRRVVARRVQPLRATPATMHPAGGRRAMVVAANVPKAAILAISHGGVRRGTDPIVMGELLVDFERIDPASVKPLAMPSERNVLMSAVMGGLSGSGGLNGIYRAAALGRL